MPRTLTDNETAVLADVLANHTPGEWWNCANEARGADAEASLLAKVTRHSAAYEARLESEGENYLTKIECIEAESA